MAPLTWKLLLATLASGQHCSQSETCEDQTALLQSHLASHKSQLGTNAEMLNFPKIASLTDPEKRKVALSQFENTAMELAENKAGVTPLVVQVCNETSELLRDTVMSAIISEHDTDVAMLATSFSAFDGVEENRLHYEGLINDAIAAVYGPGGWIERHAQCRTLESQLCVDCAECEEECDVSRETCDALEDELRLKYIDVVTTVSNHAYCTGDPPSIVPPREETTITLIEHHENKAAMEAYIAALAAFEACEESETTECTQCPAPPTVCVRSDTQECPCVDHVETRTQCNTNQTDMQQAQCDARHLTSTYMTLYIQSFEGALHRYRMVESQIRIMEADRKVEWDTLERVICLLLTLSVDEDGSASSVDTANAIDNCRTQDVDTTHLDILYPVPPSPDDLPALPHNPCGEEFQNDAFENVPPPCAGNPLLTQEYDSGLITDCTCSAEAPTRRNVSFPYELGPFLMFDTGLALNVAEGFIVNQAMDAWEATYEGVQYAGRCSPFADVTLPDLDAAFGLEGDQVVSRMAWAYPDNQAYTDMLANNGLDGSAYMETMTHRFLRSGGYVYLNAAGTAVALKEISPSPPTLQIDPFAQLTLTFDAPQGITVDQANHACPGGFAPTIMQEIIDGGGLEYCWDKSGTLSICPHGCFTFKTTQMEGVGYLAFPLMESTAHLAPAHYAPTDQQGATVASMITGVIAATNAPTEAEAA